MLRNQPERRHPAYLERRFAAFADLPTSLLKLHFFAELFERFDRRFSVIINRINQCSVNVEYKCLYQDFSPFFVFNFFVMQQTRAKLDSL